MAIKNNISSMQNIHVGFIPLVDCAPLVIAKELGFDKKFGLSIHLHKEVSWANIRDKVNIGRLDCAQMLAGMPIAASLGKSHVKETVIAPIALNLNGNAITVSRKIYAHMMDLAPEETQAGGMLSGFALKKVIDERSKANKDLLTFGMVYPFSNHNYDLRYWLAAAGIHPDKDVKLVVIPPSLIPESLKAGHIDGFCVGEPWNTVAVQQDIGCIIATKYELWNNSPEKVLGVRQSWAEQNQELLLNLLKAIYSSAKWLEEPENQEDAIHILSQPHYTDVPPDYLKPSLSGQFIRTYGGAKEQQHDFMVFHRYAANYPWRSHAIWIMTQMIRWGQLTKTVNLKSAAEQIYRPDLYRTAISDLGHAVPEIDYKVEGQHAQGYVFQEGQAPILLGSDLFFNSEVFDPDQSLAYMSKQYIHSRISSVDDLD